MVTIIDQSERDKWMDSIMVTAAMNQLTAAVRVFGIEARRTSVRLYRAMTTGERARYRHRRKRGMGRAEAMDQ
jgi:hypothetical protein